MKTLTLATIATAICSSAYANASVPEASNVQYWLGAPALERPERTIRIDADTHAVNVVRMETIRFELSNGKTFTWRFDGLPQRTVKLDQIAPAGAIGTQPVSVFVSRNKQIDGGH